MRTLDLVNAGFRGGRARRGFPAGFLLFGVLVFVDIVVYPGGHEACQQVAEGRVVVHADGALTGAVVFVDVDPGEERLVEQAAGGVGGLEVGGVAVAGQVQAVGQGLAGLLVAVAGSTKLLVDVRELAGDTVLLGLEQVEGDGSGVVGVEQFLPLCGQDGALGFEVTSLSGGCFLEGVEVFEDEFLDVVAQVRG